MTEWALFLSKQTMQYHSNPSLCSKQEYWRSCSWMVLWRPTRPSSTNTSKKCPLHYRGLECKDRKSRDNWSNRQTWPWSTKWGRSKANRVLTKWGRSKANRVLSREHNVHSKHPLPTTKGKILHMDITKWSILKSDWLYSLQAKMKYYTVSRNKTRSWLWLRPWTLYCKIET